MYRETSLSCDNAFKRQRWCRVSLEVEALVLGGRPASGLGKDDLKDLIASVEPRFRDAHIGSTTKLDDRV